MNERSSTGAAVSVVALAVLVVRQFHPDLLDTVDSLLIAVALMPWLASLIRRAEFPGGLKIEFRDVEAAGSRITGPATGSADTGEGPSLFAGAVDADPNLVLVGFRIELERRLRELARRYSMNDQQSLMRILRQLRERGVLSHPMLSGLQELVRFGNEAAHGARVDEAAVSWARDVGPRILAILDERLATGE